jgi:Flp pilus assembly protein TadB
MYTKGFISSRIIRVLHITDSDIEPVTESINITMVIATVVLVLVMTLLLVAVVVVVIIIAVVLRKKMKAKKDNSPQTVQEHVDMQV